MKIIKAFLDKIRGEAPIITAHYEDMPLVNYSKLMRILHIGLLFMVIFFIFIPVVMSGPALSFVISWLIAIGLSIIGFKKINFLKHWVADNFYLEYELLNFIIDNNLCNEKSGLSAMFSYKLTDEELIVIGVKQGTPFDKNLEDLEVELQGLLSMPVKDKVILPDVVEYHFSLKHEERLILQPSSKKESVDSQEITLGYGVVYNPVKTPHILVAGGTGSGKSVLISTLLLEFVKRSGVENIYICDPKNSDLGSLSFYLGRERVASTPNQIAKVVRLVVEEMQARYAFMKEPDNFKYGTNFSDHGYKAVWLIFDEIGAFQASRTDKQSKAVVSEVMDDLKQIILLGRQAGVFILVAAQQMRAETLNTDLRDNLGLRIALGANSAEGYRMVFGSALPETIPNIEVKGSGLLYMQGSGKQYAEYWESPYLDTDNFDFINELELQVG